MGFSRQENWSGLPHPPPGDLPHPGVEPVSRALAGRFLAPPGRLFQLWSGGITRHNENARILTREPAHVCPHPCVSEPSSTPSWPPPHHVPQRSLPLRGLAVFPFGLLVFAVKPCARLVSGFFRRLFIVIEQFHLDFVVKCSTPSPPTP